MSKIWFITGSSRGLGRAFTAAALERGDKVAATARDTGALDELRDAYGDAVLPLALDVTDKAAVDVAVKRAYEHFGRLDVVVNNAGAALFGVAVEELAEEDLRAVMETNLYGPLRVTQAVLPYLRTQGNGHIVQISSASGLVAHPTLGGYNATKWALEGMSEALAAEVAQYGVKVTIVEPAQYRTDIGTTPPAHFVPNPAYDGLRAAFANAAAQATVPDPLPEAAAPAMLKLVDAEHPPLRVVFRSQPLPMIRQAYAERLATWADWEHLSREAEGVPA
ncbi:SDR family NAD(P)-dependent oxidoreductase [Nocardia lijiangensis]|uniref:SDR family NAD(P)-dependent oxidoreductase n=1 Tax=Nocardia lijiangensis TaxID=299618 RepID=UPI0008347C0E|nr:SDR family NAD(P)-dependent oxidoreductase [Nocardia lijiangensis]